MGTRAVRLPGGSSARHGSKTEKEREIGRERKWGRGGSREKKMGKEGGKKTGKELWEEREKEWGVGGSETVQSRARRQRMKGWMNKWPNQVTEWVKQTEWGSASASECVCASSESVWASGWVGEQVQQDRETEREKDWERERGYVPSERTHSSGCDWSMGQLTRGALSSSCTLLFIPPLPHTAILPPHDTQTHTHWYTHIYTVGTTLRWHFILSFTIVQPWTQRNYRGYIQLSSRAHCGLKSGRMREKMESSSSREGLLILGAYSDSRRCCNLF